MAPHKVKVLCSVMSCIYPGAIISYFNVCIDDIAIEITLWEAWICYLLQKTA